MLLSDPVRIKGETKKRAWLAFPTSARDQVSAANVLSEKAGQAKGKRANRPIAAIGTATWKYLRIVLLLCFDDTIDRGQLLGDRNLQPLARSTSHTSPAMLRQCSSRLVTPLVAARRHATSARATATRHIAPLHSSSSARAEVLTDKDPQLGDYPELPFENLQRRKYDPGWWDPQEKRNFGETVSLLWV